MNTLSPAPTPRAATTFSTFLAEAYKLVSVRSTWWFLGGATAVMLAVALSEPDDGDPTTVLAVTAAVHALLYYVQYILLALGVLVATNEFASRGITVTLACTPSRTRVMAARTLVVGTTLFTVGTAIAALGVGVAGARFDELGTMGAQHAGQVVAMGLYLALLAVLGLGIGTLVRRTAGALAILVVLLLLVPELLGFAADRLSAPWLATFAEYTPSPAGWLLMSGQWEYAPVLAAWAAAAVGAGAWVLRARDV